MVGGTVLTVKKIMKSRRQKQAEAQAVLQLYDACVNLHAEKKKTQEEIDMVEKQQLASRVAEGCDVEMAEASVNILRDFFPQGIEEKINSLGTAAEREAFFRTLTMCLAEVMKVKIVKVGFEEFDSPTTVGQYSGDEKCIRLNRDWFLDA